MSEPNRLGTHQATQDFIAYYAGSIDTVSGHPVTLDAVHHHIHEEKHYTRSITGTINAGTANAVTVSIRPGVSQRMHFSGEVTADKAGYWEIYENPDIAAYTGTIIPFNNNRNSSNLAEGTFTTTLTIASLGTLIQGPRFIGANQPPSRFGGGDQTRHEWILNPSYEYLLWYVAANATTQVDLEIQFYEVDA